MLKVYICSSLKDDNYKYVTGVLKELPPAIHLRPTPGPVGGTLEDRRHHVEVDVAMIQYCDEVWVIGAYGRDCSWEMGYAMGLNKHVRILSDLTNRETLSLDWMIYHGEQVDCLSIHTSAHAFKTGVMNSGGHLS